MKLVSEPPRRLLAFGRGRGVFVGNRGFQATDAHCRIGIRSKDNEKEETFPAHTFGIS
jgi:hypothetical protein